MWSDDFRIYDLEHHKFVTPEEIEAERDRAWKEQQELVAAKRKEQAWAW